LRSLKLRLFILATVGLISAMLAASALSSAKRNEVLSAGAPDAASTYNNKCAKCHGRDGRSKTSWGRRTHARDISSGEWQNDVSDERIFNSIRNGKGKMPSYKKSLSESQIDGLVNHVRRLRK
jgi:mono/diheme cytochrome c family protein